MISESESVKRSWFFLLTVALLGCCFFQGCAGALFKVKPVVELSPMPESSKTVDAGGIKLRVAPLLTDEESQELFEANLPISGLLPLRIELDYDSGVPLELKKARFRLRDAEGEWKLLSSRQAVSRILKANEIFFYNPNSRKQLEKEFGTYELDLKTPLDPANRRRQGFLFFQTSDKKPVESPQGLTLIVERLPEPVTISLN
jgi:hypothetical protein